MIVYRDIADENGNKIGSQEIYNIREATYTGKDMGERQITATFESDKIIDFKIGDYLLLDISNFRGYENDYHDEEKFYLYTLPTIKKTARSGSVKDAFEYNITFYPAQYELQTVMMRDMMQAESNEELNAQNVLYTGYDTFSFIGGAHTLMRRIQYVLNERFGESTWDYVLNQSVDEDLNTALEPVQFDFSENTVWDALNKLSDENGLNTTWYIIDRTIFVGYDNPFVFGIDANLQLTTIPHSFQYGKTSHKALNSNDGGLLNIQKTIGTKLPITRLFGYGSERNVNRFYCADVIRSGRYVNKLMLPSFSTDGKTDYIDSASGIEQYGIREGVKNFDEIYPSLRYITYGDLRQIRYCIKIMGSGNEPDTDNIDITAKADYPVARVQCYKVTDNGNGVNVLVEAQPPQDLAVFVHATGKTVKCTLYGVGKNQSDYDDKVPMRNGQYIVGSCFCVHDDGYKDPDGTLGTHTKRPDWFQNPDAMTSPTQQAQKDAIQLRQINYTDDCWITDVFVFEKYEFAANETPHFNRDGYSAYCYPRVTDDYPNSSEDTQVVNEVVQVQPIEIVDTDENRDTNRRQTTFDVYLRDVGFKINEQSVFGNMQFLLSGAFTINFYDGNLAGLDFEVSAANGSEADENVVPAFLSDGTRNDLFFKKNNADDPAAIEAYNNGAFWKITCKRNTDNDYMWLPNTLVNAKGGDHVVFLNIYMPDVYIRAAEQRLYQEAQEYLNDNCEGDISYYMEFDKVRLTQVEPLALQMREGALMRISDSDLDLSKLNVKQSLFEGFVQHSTRLATSTLKVDYTTEIRSAADRRYYIDRPNNQEQTDEIKLVSSSIGGRFINGVYDDAGKTGLQFSIDEKKTDNSIRFLLTLESYQIFIANGTEFTPKKDDITLKLIIQNVTTGTQQTQEFASKSVSLFRTETNGDRYYLYKFTDNDSDLTKNITFIGLESGEYKAIWAITSNYSEVTQGGDIYAYARNVFHTWRPAQYDGQVCDLQLNQALTPAQIFYLQRGQSITLDFIVEMYFNSNDALVREEPLAYLNYDIHGYNNEADKGTLVPFNQKIESVTYDAPTQRYVYKISFSVTTNRLVSSSGGHYEIGYYAKVPHYSTDYNAAAGQLIYCRANQSLRFRRGKYYKLRMTLNNKLLADGFEFALLQSSDKSNLYIPNYTLTVASTIGNTSTVEIAFALPTAFAASGRFYPAIGYYTDGVTEYGTVGLYSVVEQTSASEDDVIDYVDLTIDSITIKLTDSGVKSPSIYREITAEVKTYRYATKWDSLNAQATSSAIGVAQVSKKQSQLSRKVNLIDTQTKR